jgi:hypothetical protein
LKSMAFSFFVSVGLTFGFISSWYFHIFNKCK